MVCKYPCRSLLALCFLALGLGAVPVSLEAASGSASQALRNELASAPPPALAEIVATYQLLDPTARFTFLRGHVDSFSAHPKPEVPAYARTVLEAAGLPTDPVSQPAAETTFEPKDAEGDGALSAESLPGGDVGNSGANDNGEQDGGVPVEQDEQGQETTWYPQLGANLAKPILGEFLSTHSDLFELSPQYLSNGVRALELLDYGVGRHFRRVEFAQKIGPMPVLDGKTLVLFDLNWNVVSISRQLMTRQKLGLAFAQTISAQVAGNLAFEALGLASGDGRIMNTARGVDPIRSILAWQVQIEDASDLSEYTVTLNGQDGELLNISDDSARFNDAQVKRWDYVDGDRTDPNRIITTNVYTHDDNTLVHDFFYLVNDDRNDGGTGVCSDTSPDSNSTPNAYGTTNSAEYVRPTRRGDRNFTLWNPQAPKGSFGESHVYYWARKYMQWQKQALVDLGVLTLGNFNNYTKALIIVNGCDGGAGNFKSSFSVSTMDDLGEGLGTIQLPERCRAGNANCSATDYDDANSGNLYTYEGDGGYHFPGVIDHELNHFVLIDYFGVNNSVDCSIGKELKYFQEGGLGRTLPQMYWHSKYDVGYLPDTTDKLFRSDSTSGEVHDETDANSFNELADFACADGTDAPYSWGSVVAQPMWEIYHGQKIEGAIRFSMARPALDKGMIKSMYYAADMASASTFQDRWELANRFMEFWELFSTAVPDTKGDWCEVWGHHGMDTFINSSFCS